MSAPAPSASSSSKKTSTGKSKLSAPTDAAGVEHVNPAPVPEVAAVADPLAGKQRERGPVEEVIAKRMRQVGKKLQRYRAYVSQDPTTLNADQKAALVSLPALEGAYKELEDLIREKGPVDEQELIQAAKVREATEAAKAAAVAEASVGVEQFKASLVTPLSLFLRLHTLLHPARSADHEHLTFGHLTLPSHLQDEVQATDVLRVGRMWEDLCSGGEAATAVLESLSTGVTEADDDEAQHVHHLLELVSQPEPAPAQAEAEPEVDTYPNTRSGSVDEAGEVGEVGEVQASTATSEYEQNGGFSSQEVSGSTGAINFLQADELEERDVDEAPIEDSYEVVPMLEPHQTSGQQPPIESELQATAPLDLAPPLPSQTRPSFVAQKSTNWADLDDDDEIPTFSQPSAITESQEPVIQHAQPAPAEVPAVPAASEPSTEKATAETPTKTTPTRSGGPSRGRGQGKKQSNRPPRPQQSQQSQNQQQPSQQQDGSKLLDDDGFEMKVRRVSQPTRGGSGGRGRGGADRGRGRGGARGGRGGANGNANGRPAEGAAPSKVQGEAGQGQKGGKPKPPQQQQQQPAAPKPSIFKAVQPSGPVSAPIL